MERRWIACIWGMDSTVLQLTIDKQENFDEAKILNVTPNLSLVMLPESLSHQYAKAVVYSSSQKSKRQNKWIGLQKF